MEKNLNKNNQVLKDQVKRLKITRKSKINLAISISLIALFSIFFLLNVIIHSKLETIEFKMYKNNKNLILPFIIIDNFETLKNYKIAINVILNILSNLELLIVYINIIYLILHPFIGLKLIFIVNISYFCLILLKIIIQSHRPFWNLKDKIIIQDCKTDYASPSPLIFFICFFYLYSIIIVQKLKKQKFNIIQKILLFLFHFIIISVISFLLEITLDEYFHQLIFTTILGYILICLLISNDKKVHNFIFQTLKNVYNARKYKIKIFFYIIGLIIITLITSNFINENNLNIIKQELKDCQNNLFGIKESLKNIGHMFSIVGAVWGASFTIEKDISKWWDKSPILILIMKLFIILVFNGLFVTLKYYSSKFINEIELNYILSFLFNFIQNFLSFGIIPLIFEKLGLIENMRKNKKENKSKNINIEDEQVNLFRTSIFKEEKDKSDEGFIIIDKELKKTEKKENEGIELNKDKISEENEYIYDKNKEDREEEIYGHSNLVENIQNLDEEEEYLYLEGIEEEQEQSQKNE